MLLWTQRLLRWYAAHRRDLPWRGHADPYAVWISEIMLQQTRVDTVCPYFERFLARFPTVATLASAPMPELLKLWEGLGYYARARNLQAAARQIVAHHHGHLPRTATALAALPGIGPYTAAAIASICFAERVPVVDGNVARVFSRYLGWSDDFRKLPARRKLADWLQPQMARVRVPGDCNQAMMELGALLCLPRTPQCARCPLAATCHACRSNTQAAFPMRPARPAIPTRHAVAVVIQRRGHVLLVQRRERGLLGGFWELPGGDVAHQPTTRMAAAVVRRQTDLTISRISAHGELTHIFSHFRLHLALYTCQGARGRLRTGAAIRTQWASAVDLASLPVSTAHRRALQAAGPAAHRHPITGASAIH
ncbi:MAG: A/G-specific adenine glycosylase [bacterium]